jgi:hypothetical protein
MKFPARTFAFSVVGTASNSQGFGDFCQKPVRAKQPYISKVREYFVSVITENISTF